MDALDAWFRSKRGAILEELKAFVRIPSVSTDPAYKSGVASAAEFVAQKLFEAGLADARVRPTKGHPVVTASWRGAPGKPTVLIYGHFDVQPPDPLDAWNTKPFEPEIRDGRLYGRGASDDKGPMLIPIKVAEAFFACEGALPVNMVFLFEGEEEVSSAHLEAFVAENRDYLAADLLSADGAQWRADLPSVITGSRGICALEITVRGAAKDLHSGRHGGAVANPIRDLARILAAFTTTQAAWLSPDFMTLSSICPSANSKTLRSCHGARRTISTRLELPPAPARLDTRCCSEIGCARRWSSAAFPVATRAPARKR
jgi:acetylornithine deacetylase/succinyl-diaminopimelate desuccinylase-like protein